MKIVAISDLHQYSIKNIQLPPGDVLIIAGDLNIKYPIEAEILLNHLTGLPFHDIILVPGNHDFAFEFGKIQDRGNVHILIDKEIKINGYKFYGTPWMPWFCDWSFMKTEEELEVIYNNIPLDTDVLITHGPAHGILDVNDIDEHCGSTALKQWFARVYGKSRGLYHFFGHIHEGGGEHARYGKNNFYNCSLLNEKYEMVNKPIEVEI